jgi:hypothetical protein
MPSSSTIKYKVYRVAVVALGAALGFWLHTLLLLALPRGYTIEGAPFVVASLLAAAAGALGGVPLGKAWWRIVYVERRGGLCRNCRRRKR